MRALHAIVLAGGSGRRLAALTEKLTGRTMPKQYCAFTGGRTLLQHTLARLAPLAPPHRTTVVVHEAYRETAREQLASFRGAAILTQPSDRGTGSGLLRALVHVLRRDPEAVVVVSPSDHGIRDEPAYLRGIREAVGAAALAAAVLLGVEADEPHTDYGWIVPGRDLAPGVRAVTTFVEKPAASQAAALIECGALYSTMVLAARARTLVDLFERSRPGLAALFTPLALLPPRARALHLQRAYALLPSCDFSRDILAAAAKELAVVRWRRAVGWTDLGTPERVAEWMAYEPPPRAARGDRVPVAS